MNSLSNAEDAKDWTYLGEGNQNLVVKYTGKSPYFKDKVLRIRKATTKGKECHAVASKESVLFQQLFQENVIGKLLGNEYITTMTPIKTSREFLSSLSVKIESSRPAHRLEREIDNDSDISFILKDLTQPWPGLPCLTFELKPKWGFMPYSNNIHEIKSRYCRFCMHKHMRNKSNSSSATNTFCPLDLYSLDPVRVGAALDVLLKELQTMEKTLKVSVNGTKISLKDNNVQSDLLSFLGPSAVDIDTIKVLHTLLQHILLSDPILGRLKSLQSRLDKFDIENILPLYLDTNKEEIITDDISVWEDVVNTFLNHALGEKKQIQKIYEYILSMTFKDCSVMINVIAKDTFISKEHKSIVIDNIEYYYDVKVIDVDLKKAEKIPYWFELDQSITQYAVETKYQKRSTCS